MYFFFFSSRRRHTRLQGDWSSDVCSSDLDAGDRSYGGLAGPFLSPPRRRRRCRGPVLPGRPPRGAPNGGGGGARGRGGDRTAARGSPTACRARGEGRVDERARGIRGGVHAPSPRDRAARTGGRTARSEERRVWKECR